MTKLSDIQLILLSAASQRKDGHFLPLPDAVVGNAVAANKAIADLLKKGFASEAHAKIPEQTWRQDDDWRIGLKQRADCSTCILRRSRSFLILLAVLWRGS